MVKEYWTSAEVSNIFQLKKREVSRQTLFNAEERGEIPVAERIKRGSLLARQWKTSQLPEIGKRFGFISKPEHQSVICVYTAKGGVLKTTMAYTLAKVLALNGLKVLLIGLDIQCSLTDITLPRKEYESLDEVEDVVGLYKLLYDKCPLSEAIQHTELPTLDIIPETHDLNLLEKALRLANRREYFFKDKLLPSLTEYDIIIFDNGPSWNQLIENALVASDTLVSPIGCDLLSYKAVETNLNTIFEFGKAMKVAWKNVFLIPTLLEKNKLSQTIYGTYLNTYKDIILSIPIRRAIKGQESLILGQSSIEHDPTSPLAQDYFDLIQEMWKKIGR